MRLTHTRRTSVLSVTALSLHFTRPRIYHRGPDVAFCSSGWKKTLRASRPASVISQQQYRHAAGPWRKIRRNARSREKRKREKKKSCGAAKREEASNCFPSVCDPETLEEFFLVLLLRVNQHSLLIWWHRLLHNMVL